MWLVLLGPPGSGKGTQAKELAEKLGWVHLSTGDILREVASTDTPVGQKAKLYLDRGELVPDHLILDLVSKRLNASNSGLIFDGFPRTVLQAESLERLARQKKATVDLAVNLKVTDEEIIQRLQARRSCPKCGAVFNLIVQPPQKNNICDRCSSTLITRNDDAPEVVKRRLLIYYSEIAPLKAYYQKQSKLREVDGQLDSALVQREIIKLIESCPKSP